MSVIKFMKFDRGLEAGEMAAMDENSLSTGTPTKALAAASRPSRLALSIRTKGLMVFAALMVYTLFVDAFVYHQKELLLRDFEEIQQTLEAEALMKEVDVSTFHAVMTIFANIDAPDPTAGLQRIAMHHQSLLHRHAELLIRLPQSKLSVVSMNAAWNEVNQNPSRANLNRFVVELIKIKNSIGVLTEQSQDRRKQLSDRYRSHSDSVAITTFLLGMLGLALLGAIIGLFFRRLTDDLRTLQTRALDIVKGYRGTPIPLTRHDEVGQLISAVNGMERALDTREKELMVERQKYFHQEKMAAIGTLAAGVAHEIGNPIAAISGIAQEMAERKMEKLRGCRECRPDLIYAQTQRLTAITREISEFASPQAVEPQFLDLNGQLRSTSSLIRYDKRLQRVVLKLDLDPQLPAIYGVADQLTQLIMNLLINAMDALEGVYERAATITISTSCDQERILMAIEDNGHGMDQATLTRVFEAFFTTKPAGKGTGLGLSLCYSIMKKHGGTIEMESTPGVGTQVQVFFPLTEAAYNQANSV
jgi:two-component system, NtrC family, sensor kinase